MVASEIAGIEWCGGEQKTAARAEAAGRWWAEVAAFEHASVASFGRFLLQLIRLGAPPDLLARTAEAAADEVRHATAAYAIAASLLGRPVSAGPLDVERGDEVWDAAGILREVIRDGCVGESLAVAEAGEAARGVEDPAVRAALEAVVQEEARHAALAWRTARWLLDRDPSLRAVAVVALDEATEQAAQVVPGITGAERWGVLSSVARTAARRKALIEVIPRLAEAVLGAERQLAA